MKVTDTNSIKREITIKLDEEESRILYNILERDQKNDYEKEFANSLINSLEAPDSLITFN